MASFEKILKLDVAHEQSYIYLKCKQYDHNSRIYKLILTNEHIPIILAGTELVTVHIQRNDGTYVDDVCQWQNGSLYLTMTDSMLAVAGDASMEVKVFDGNKEILSTMTNHVKVEKSMLPYDRMVASDEFNVLNHLIQSVLNAGEYAEDLEELLQNFRQRISEFERQFIQISTEGRALIQDLKDIIDKAAGIDEKLEQLDDGIDRIQNALENADQANNKANEALTILNNIIEQIDDLDGIILSETQPQDQELLGLWLVEEEDGIKKVGQKVADNKNENDYRFVKFAGSDVDADGNVFIDFSGEIITENPDYPGSITSNETLNFLKQKIEKNASDISKLNADKLDKKFSSSDGDKYLITDTNGNIIVSDGSINGYTDKEISDGIDNILGGD